VALALALLALPCQAPRAKTTVHHHSGFFAMDAVTPTALLATAATLPDAAALQLWHTYRPRPLTLSTSEGAPYGDTDFWPEADTTTTAFGYGPTMVQRVYICLSGMVKMADCSAQPPPSGPLSDAMLAGIDERIGRFAGTGKRLLVRFVYNLGPIGSSARDVPAALITTHIDQLAPILHKHQDLVFALQAGFIGTWGEWHSSTAGNKSAAARNRIVQHLVHQFRGRFPILMRYPGQMIEALGNAKADPDLGLHDDYFASDATDGGTWASYNNPSVSSPELLKQFAEEVANRSMFVGEFGSAGPGPGSPAPRSTATPGASARSRSRWGSGRSRSARRWPPTAARNSSSIWSARASNYRPPGLPWRRANRARCRWNSRCGTPATAASSVHVRPAWCWPSDGRRSLGCPSR